MLKKQKYNTKEYNANRKIFCDNLLSAYCFGIKQCSKGSYIHETRKKASYKALCAYRQRLCTDLQWLFSYLQSPCAYLQCLNSYLQSPFKYLQSLLIYPQSHCSHLQSFFTYLQRSFSNLQSLCSYLQELCAYLMSIKDVGYMFINSSTYWIKKVSLKYTKLL